MIATCKRCKALNLATGTCVLGHEIEAKQYVAGVAIAFSPEIGICEKPTTNSALSFLLRAKSTPAREQAE